MHYAHKTFLSLDSHITKSILMSVKYKTLALTCTLLAFSALRAQESEKPLHANEIRLNVLGLVAPGLLDLSYERLLDQNQSLGLQAAFYIPSDGDDEYIFNQSVSALYRLYTSKEGYAEGFFLQLGLNMASVNNDVIDLFENRIETEFFFGPEVGMGGKWVIRKGLTIELGASLSRTILSDNAREFNGQYWLSIGKRF